MDDIIEICEQVAQGTTSIFIFLLIFALLIPYTLKDFPFISAAYFISLITSIILVINNYTHWIPSINTVKTFIIIHKKIIVKILFYPVLLIMWIGIAWAIVNYSIWMTKHMSIEFGYCPGDETVPYKDAVYYCLTSLLTSALAIIGAKELFK